MLHQVINKLLKLFLIKWPKYKDYTLPSTNYNKRQMFDAGINVDDNDKWALYAASTEASGSIDKGNCSLNLSCCGTRLFHSSLWKPGCDMNRESKLPVVVVDTGYKISVHWRNTTPWTASKSKRRQLVNFNGNGV